jgi:predicted RNase H-like HicB family nuclease
MIMMTYTITLFRTSEGYSVSCPALPGCWSEGDTEAEALANIREAIREYRVVRDVLLSEERQGADEVREMDVTI